MRLSTSRTVAASDSSNWNVVPRARANVLGAKRTFLSQGAASTAAGTTAAGGTAVNSSAMPATAESSSARRTETPGSADSIADCAAPPPGDSVGPSMPGPESFSNTNGRGPRSATSATSWPALLRWMPVLRRKRPGAGVWAGIAAAAGTSHGAVTMPGPAVTAQPGAPGPPLHAHQLLAASTPLPSPCSAARIAGATAAYWARTGSPRPRDRPPARPVRSRSRRCPRRLRPRSRAGGCG